MGLLYDAGASDKSKTAARAAGFSLITSGIVRNSAKSPLSFVQRESNKSTSSLRMRVENFIGIVKQRFRVLDSVFPLEDLGIMDDVVFACFVLHNFNNPIIL